MADVSDVENAIVTLAAFTLYPNGTGNPSLVTAPCRVRRGWPNAAALDTDLAAGVVNVTVFSKHGHTRDTTRWRADWTNSSVSTPTMTATVNAAQNQVTIAGSSGVKQNVGIKTSTGVYAVTAQAADTPATAATALAALVPGASASAGVITLPYDPHLIARVGGVGTAAQEVRRQTQGIVVVVWAPTQPLRDQVAAAVDVALASISFLQLADNTLARLTYLNTVEDDNTTKDRLWRRDLQYLVEYGTMASRTAAQALFGTGNSTEAGNLSTVYT